MKYFRVKFKLRVGSDELWVFGDGQLLPDTNSVSVYVLVDGEWIGYYRNHHTLKTLKDYEDHDDGTITEMTMGEFFVEMI